MSSRITYAVIGAAMIACGAAQAQDYPNRFVKFVVTYPLGGSSDVMARIVGQKLTEYWGQQVIVDSKPGGDGAIGMEFAARQAPDGYTFLLGNFGPVVANPLISKVSYDWQKDFVPVSQITQSANILVIPVTSTIKSTRELIAAANAQPGVLTYATSGVGGMQHLAGEMFKRLAGVTIITVNYKGNAQAITDVMGGQINMMFSDALPAMLNMKSGKLRALAVTSEKRWPFTPELPTLAEEGVTGFAAANWWGILFPRGVPQPIVDKVNAALVKALTNPEVKTRLGDLGVEARPGTPEQFGEFMAKESAKYAKLIKDANIRAE